jgi:predicted PurR-regulated permease PerM
LRVGLVFLLLVWSYDVVKPFTVPILWGAIIAMAAFPLVKWLEPKLGGRRGLTCTLVTVFFLVLLVVPTWLATETMFESLHQLRVTIENDQLRVPAPPPSVEDWPVIGKKVFALWTAANRNLEAVLTQLSPQIKELTTKLLKRIGGSLIGVLMFVVSLIIAGGFMAFADSCARAANRVFVRIGGVQPGGEWAAMAVATVRSVLQGVIGVAFIQTILVAIGLFVADVPGAPLWSAIVLFLAIAQLPPLILLAPIMAYLFSTADITTAVIFTVYELVAGFSDAFLKPLLMGRGLDVPMPIILIGAIGGMIAMGIIGLFVGAVVLSIWYKLFGLWMQQESH